MNPIETMMRNPYHNATGAWRESRHTGPKWALLSRYTGQLTPITEAAARTRFGATLPEVALGYCPQYALVPAA